ncbi:hypothetical protein JOJ87_001449 [Rhodococcus ruber]|uniref:MrcB family domain-containing protein n=1 Tax=Rhodococcus ruber TaxID=1830 RepID=UPI001AEB5055|nr:DUF3578 domain-containing protein [Rhodococcus ruber]MBP2211105.1 hypothetical protein [Rhodococcus ruber]
MREAIEEILELQDEYSPKKTPAMDRRRELISGVIVPELRDFVQSHPALAPLGWSVQGKNSSGSNSGVPWVRVYSPEKSPSATDGTYIVFLFGQGGRSAYLVLMGGTSQWSEARQKFLRRPPAEVAAKVDWARTALAAEETDDLLTSISLDSDFDTPRGYERGAMYAIEYPKGAIPGDDELKNDVVRMVRLLQRLYEVEPPTGSADDIPEVSDAVLSATQAAGNTRKTKARGQGFALTQDQKIAVEERAVAVATEYFENLYYAVENVGATESFDLVATKGDERLTVEVKGTTSLGQEVVLTRNEVLHHKEAYPNNALVIVRSIVLDRTVEPPAASGGVIGVTHPWAIDDEDLTPVSYRYATGL